MVGIVVAGTIAVWVPQRFWRTVFLSAGDGVGGLQMIENALVGSRVAVVSFVCSVGNVPMAAALLIAIFPSAGRWPSSTATDRDPDAADLSSVLRHKLAAQLSVLLYIAWCAPDS